MKISLERASLALKSGKVIAIPTETVYGLAAHYDCPAAVQEIFILKNRPQENPLILHLASSDDIAPFTSFLPPFFKELSAAFWPGPLTLVLPVHKSRIPSIVRADLPTQAFRVPAHPLTRELLAQTGPLVAPSANLSGKPSSVSPEHVEADFGLDFPVLDGGLCEKGIESTILIWDQKTWHMGRLGAIASECFIPILGYDPQVPFERLTPNCPGQFFKHYAPSAKLHLGGDFREATLLIGFSDRTYPQNAKAIYWGSSNAPEEALHQLYSVLRFLDEKEIKEAWVDINVPQEGLWLTFLERLNKASKN